MRLSKNEKHLAVARYVKIYWRIKLKDIKKDFPNMSYNKLVRKIWNGQIFPIK